MSGIERVNEGLDGIVTLLERGVRAMLLAAVVVALACICALTVAATYGILHPGDDFDFRLDRGQRAPVGDVIVLR
jgi:hypothetical protein